MISFFYENQAPYVIIAIVEKERGLINLEKNHTSCFRCIDWIGSCIVGYQR